MAAKEEAARVAAEAARQAEDAEKARAEKLRADEAERQRKDKEASRRLIVWTAVGTAAVAGIVGAVFGLRAASEHDDALDCYDDSRVDPAACSRGRFDEHKDSSQTAAVVADVLFGTGIVAGITAAILGLSGPAVDDAAAVYIGPAGGWRLPDGGLRLILGDTTPITLRPGTIEAIVELDGEAHDVSERPPPRSERTDYLYTPSAMMLRGGEGRFTQTTFPFLGWVSIGLLDHLTITLGTSLPAFVVGFPNLATGLKVGIALVGTDRLHLAAWVRTLLGSGARRAAYGGTVTIGAPDAHLSASLGRVTSLESAAPPEDHAPLGSVSGFIQLTRRFGLVADALVSVAPERIFLAGLGGRFGMEVLSADAALLWCGGSSIPLPWMALTWGWN